MDSEDRFWISLWSVIAVVIISLTALGVWNAKVRRDRFYEAVKNGTSPLELKCAFSWYSREDSSMSNACSELVKSRAVIE